MLSSPLKPFDTTKPVETILPRTVRERHCGFEDGVRYVGLGISSFGAIWCYYSQMNIPAILFTLTDLSIVIVHVTEKTCGTWARAAKAGEKILKSYNTFITQANRTTDELKKTEDEQEQIDVALHQETNTLLQASANIEHGTSEAGRNIEALKAEYEKLRTSNAQLQQSIEEQKKLIQTLQEALEKSSAQNLLYQKQAEGLTRMVSSLKHTDEKFAEDAATATTQLQEGVDNFGAKMEELHGIGQKVQAMHEENLILRQRIEELNKTKENLEGLLASITSTQTKRHQNNTELSSLVSQLETSKQELATTEGHIREELSAWQKMFAQQQPKEPT